MSFQVQIKQQVKQIRLQAEQFLTDTCIIRRKAGEIVTNGESISIYAPDVNSKCRFIVRSGSENVNIASQERATKQAVYTGLYRMQLPYDTDVTEGDLILFTDTQVNKERIFNVVFAPPHHNMTGAYIVFMQEET